jgi:DNA repair protein RecO
VECIAKGAHRPRNAFQGPFDLGVLWEVVLAERPAERGMAILTEGAIVEGFPGLRRGWASWAAGAYITEFLRAVGTEGEPSGELFDAAVGTLRTLGTDPPEAGGPSARVPPIAFALVAFEARALRILGLSAPITACAGCGRRWSGSDRPVFFAASLGGILCGACRGREPERHGVVVPGSAVRVLEGLATGSPAPSPGDRPGEPAVVPGLLPHLASLTRELRAFYLEREFKMLKYLPNFL